MQLDWRVRLGLIVGGAVVVAVAIAGAAWGALDSEIVDDALKMAGTFLAGLGIASGKGRAAAVLLFAAIPWLPSCGAGQTVDAERCTEAVLRCAVEVAANCIPHEGESCDVRDVQME